MKVFIAGIDGYLGWSLAQHLAGRGHRIGGCDCFLRREWVAEMGSQSVTPISGMKERAEAFRRRFRQELVFFEGNLTDYDFIHRALSSFQPEAIVHLAEMPSAPYSMMDVKHCIFTHTNNLIGTLNLLYVMKEVCPEAHLVKLGTMGEYGYPNLDIPEGFFEVEYRGRQDRLPFPRQAGSWYHQTKVHDSNNIMLACKIWKLRSTDVMQGVVYGTRIDGAGDDPRLLTRFDVDQCFGTAINRYCAMAVLERPLTPYGKGHQKRGFIPLRDSMQCLTLAIEHPPVRGEYRVFNQFEEVYDLTAVAEKVKTVAFREFGLEVEIRNLENPRQEPEEHYFHPDHKHLLELGYQPTHDMEAEIKLMLQDLMTYRPRLLAVAHTMLPDIHWDGRRERVKFLV